MIRTGKYAVTSFTNRALFGSHTLGNEYNDLTLMNFDIYNGNIVNSLVETCITYYRVL